MVRGGVRAAPDFVIFTSKLSKVIKMSVSSAKVPRTHPPISDLNGLKYLLFLTR